MCDDLPAPWEKHPGILRIDRSRPRKPRDEAQAQFLREWSDWYLALSASDRRDYQMRHPENVAWKQVYEMLDREWPA